MNLLVLTYHYFHYDTPYGIKREDFPFSVAQDKFENHCRALVSSGFRIIDPQELIDTTELNGGPDRQILVTIDDGHSSVEDIALNTLFKYQIKPVLNVIPGFVGYRNYLSWSTLRSLSNRGFSIQSHSMEHRNMMHLSHKQLKTDMEISKKTIEDNIGTCVKMFAVPMGQLNKSVVKIALEVGFSIIMTSFAGINTSSDDLKSLKRFQVKSHVDSLHLDRYFIRLSGVRLEGEAKNLIKRIKGAFSSSFFKKYVRNLRE
jgi:peptidoglycan/xylan/chitin deacetylase (PgdA/CDA1 family)